MGRGGDTANAKVPKYTMAQVAQHNQKGDAWLVYRSRVFDVSNWSAHPGGQIIFTHAGRDATEVFNAFHPGSAYPLLDRFYVGDLVVADRAKRTAFAADMDILRAKVRKMGLHKARCVQQLWFCCLGVRYANVSVLLSACGGVRARRCCVLRHLFGPFCVSPAPTCPDRSGMYYVWKVSSNMMIWALGAACVAYSQGSMAMLMLGAFFIGLFWQQCGWLAHDFCHHQVFDNRLWGDMFGLVIGNVWQGFSVEWWKDKHNTHHAIPNMHETEKGAHDGDPDIDTMPLLAWSQKMARGAVDAGPIGRFFIKHQAFLYFPILLIARISWLMQSFTFVFRFQSPWNQEFKHDEPLRLGIWEHIGLLAYYGWNLALMVLYMTPVQSVIFFLASQMMCGLMLAISFGLGHNGMATYDADKTPEYYEWQITTTRNVHGSWVVGWFMGGLHLQVEHHLFPDIPRHNLGKLRSMVEPLCAKHGIKYTSTSMWTGTKDVLNHLAEVTTELINEFPGL